MPSDSKPSVKSLGGGAPSLTISVQAAMAVVKGHPWVFRQQLKGGGGGIPLAEVVELRDPTGAFVARGIWDDRSQIAVRVFSRAPEELIDEDLFRRRLSRAIQVRKGWIGHDTTAYRLCHGEGDGLPGWVIDRYAHCAVVRTDGAAAALCFERWQKSVWDVLRKEGITSLARRRERSEEGNDRLIPLCGDPPPAFLVVRENGVAMHVDLATGQKTGAFLDQRENRARVRAIASGGRILNLYSYAGGFSVAAALGGALRVTSVDIAAGGHRAAQISMRANDVDPSKHDFVTADVMVYLQGAAARGQTWDIVISDPPSFAPSEKTKPRALTAYRALHRACVNVLAGDGTFCAASCSSHVNAEEFCSTLDEAAIDRSMRLLSLYGAPSDHPTVPAWPEGRYLKFAILQ